MSWRLELARLLRRIAAAIAVRKALDYEAFA